MLFEHWSPKTSKNKNESDAHGAAVCRNASITSVTRKKQGLGKRYKTPDAYEYDENKKTDEKWWGMNAHLDVAGGLSVDGAPDGVARAKHLLHGARQCARHRALAHGAGDVDDLVEGHVAVVLDVLHLVFYLQRERGTVKCGLG